MAEKLGISVTAYGKLEREESEISMERLTQIANALEISPQETASVTFIGLAASP